MLTVRPEDRIRARRLDLRRGPGSADDSRRKRGEQTLRLRQEQREEIASKRRRDVTPESGIGAEPMEVVSKKLAELPAHLQAIFDDDPVIMAPALTSLRKLLSLESRPPIQQCVDAGVIPRLVALLGATEYTGLQYEACWSLTNIASGASEHTRALVDAGAVQGLLPLMLHSDLDVRGQAVWALANIAGDGPECRDYVLRVGAMQPLLSLLVAPNPTNRIQRDATWMLSNLCRGKDAPWDIISGAIGVMSRLLYSSDNDVLMDACWALLFVTDADPSRASRLLSEGLGPQLVSLLKHPSYAVQMPALRVVGNILFGDEEQTQTMVNLHVVNGIEHLMRSDNSRLRKEATWCLSNVTAGNRTQIQSVIDNAELMHLLVDLALNAENATKQEALYTICNAINGGSPEQMRTLVLNFDVFSVLCRFMNVGDDGVITTVLKTTDNLLNTGTNDPKVPENCYQQLIENDGGLDKLEDLQDHHSDEIVQQTIHILKKYWQVENENTAPALNNNGSYAW